MEWSEKTVVADIATGVTVIKCTNFCGFSVNGTPEYCESMYDGHSHQEHPDMYDQSRWYDAVFSLWGTIIVSMVCITIVMVLTGKTLITLS